MNVKLDTTMGEIVIELFEEAAPKTVDNFLSYVRARLYEGTIFHRVIDGFMVQGGGLNENMEEGPVQNPIQNEADNGLKNDAYTVAMARTTEPHSATAQFFINVKKNDFLNHTDKSHKGWGYCVFGKVVKGHNVVNKMKGVATGRKGSYTDVPLTPIVINRAEILEPEAD